MPVAVDPPCLSLSCVLYFTPLDDLVRCLESVQIAAEQFNGDVDVHVVDNSESSEYHASVCSALNEVNAGRASIHLIKAASNDGYGAANNMAVPSLTSEFHLVINPDVVVSRDAFSISVDFLNENPSVGMVTPLVREPDGRVAHVVKGYPDCLTLLIRFLGWRWLNRLFDSRLSRYACTHYDGVDRPVFDVELAGGCFFFVRTSLFKRLDGFDPRYFLYFEDFDFCVRLRRLTDIAFVPQIKIFHAGGDVGRKHWRHHVMFVRSAGRFFLKNGFKVI